MSDKKSRKYLHLTLNERIEIQECLSHGMSFKAIANRLGKDPSGISKEIKKHVVVNTPNLDRRRKDGSPIDEVCPKLLRPPYVCNSCEKARRSCMYAKHLYYANKAQDAYTLNLRESREGIPLTREEFYEASRIISNGVKQGQHIYHILNTHNLKVSKSTVYRHLHLGYLDIAPIDLPRVVKFKPRSSRPLEYIPPKLKAGRTYDDFLAYTFEQNITSWVEMDTVVGRVGGKTLLTMNFTFCNFMIAFLMENKTSIEVTKKINELKQLLYQNGRSFGDLFPVILTDNGGEFSNISAIENDLFGKRESCLFFCDPYKSCQKPFVEKNHTLLRDIVPQGASFDSFTQQKVDLIFSHINSVKRKSLNGRTSFEMFSFIYGDIPKAFGITEIPSSEVIQSSLLLK